MVHHNDFGGRWRRRTLLLTVFLFLSEALLSVMSTGLRHQATNGQSAIGLSFLQRSNRLSRRICLANGEAICSLPLNIYAFGRHRDVYCGDYQNLFDTELQTSKEFYVGEGDFPVLTESTSQKQLPSCNELFIVITASNVYADKHRQDYRENTGLVKHTGCVWKASDSWNGCRLRSEKDECSGYVMETKLFAMLAFYKRPTIERRLTTATKYFCDDLERSLGRLFPARKGIAVKESIEKGWVRRLIPTA